MTWVDKVFLDHFPTIDRIIRRLLRSRYLHKLAVRKSS